MSLLDITLSSDTSSVKRGTKVNTQCQESACSMSRGMSVRVLSNVLVLMLPHSAKYTFPLFITPLERLSFRYVSLTLILRRSHTGTVWFYTSTSNKRAARQKLYTKSLTGDLKRMYSRLTLVGISIKL